jgi:hypothetical protein
MNKKLFFSVLLSMFSIVLFAKPISENTAKKVGANFLSSKTSVSTSMAELSMVYSMKNNTQTPYFYVFNIANKGFVIVSGDDEVLPILGYSDEGVFISDNIAPQVLKWLESYKNQIRYVIENNIKATEKIQQEWEELQKDSTVLKTQQSTNSTLSTQAVSPLVQVHWGQSPYVNAQCPPDVNAGSANGYRAVAGCPATAMAQIMKYWGYPAQGAGFHSYNHPTYGTLSANFGATTYNWASMPNYVNSSNSEVAKLMYHCGVAVEMQYGPTSSGSYVIMDGYPAQQTCEYAYKTYFGYNPTTLQGLKRSNYSDSNWINLLKNELNASRPIQYAGFGGGSGHTFVCDGYDNNNLFHMNWGWAGSSDGYFNLNALNPGSLGTGGGSGGYNNNQQAVIGIQPLNAPQTFDLSMYSDLSTSQSSYWFGGSITVTAQIQNSGAGAFSGEFAAAVFNSNGQFVSFLSSPQTSNLSTGFYTTKTFTNAGGAPFIPGNYSVSVFYRLNGGSWTIVADEIGVIFNEVNLSQFEVNYSSNIETYSNFNTTTNNGILYQGQSATINVNATNTNASTFFGDLRVNLSNLDGTFAQNIQILTENNGLPNNYSYTNGLNFTGNITVAPGTYLMELAYKPQGTSNWIYAGSTNFQNPIFVTVQAPPYQPDQYENNNTFANSYTFSPVFSNNIASLNTTSSNIHIGNDNDFYKVILPTGYAYTISARLHDSFNSNNGNTYSVDALFSYSTDNGVTWSEVFDTMPNNNIIMQNGGNIIFRVANYFEGNMGTYLLDVGINRQTLDTQDFDLNNQIKVYPNPAKDFVNINISDYANDVTEIKIYNIQGQIVRSIKVQNETIVQIPLDNLTSGFYFAQIYSTKGVSTKKIIINK